PQGRREALMQVAQGVNELGLAADTRAMFHRIQADYLALQGVWRDAPAMQARECALHVLRLALISRIWLLETEIPDFTPRFGLTREGLRARILRLDVLDSLKFLAEVFPRAADPATTQDYAEPPGPREGFSYAKEHEEIFEPMRRAFDLVREIGVAITHEVGAFG
ncbi:MAG: phosphoenolpyruvate carboxylase, partial [Acidocella sp.]|nr:phosphoenolpyruvate carboxylase [Acidocella sp.]